MLPNDWVNASDAQILLSLEAGSGQFTGYGPGSFYEFSDFRFTSGTVLDDIAVTSANIVGLVIPSYDKSLDLIQISIDSLTMPDAVCPGTVNCGTVTMTFRTEDIAQVPEPSTYALLASQLVTIAGFAYWRRSKR
jgi:hypothetical protein